MNAAPRIVTVTLNASIDQTASIPNFTAGEVNRVAWEQSDAGGKGVNVASFLADFGYAIAVTGVLGTDNQELFLRKHETDGLRGRHVPLIEFALGACDRIDDTAIQIGTDWAVARHADVRKRVNVQRKPSRECRLADEQHRPGVIIARGKVGKRREPGSVIAPFGKARQEGQGEFAFAKDVENLGLCSMA